MRNKKIIILSNKNTYSASEWLIYKLASLNPKITLVNPKGQGYVLFIFITITRITIY